MKKLVVVACIVCLWASPALADRYVAGEIGAYFPEEGSFDTGLNLEVAYGMDLKDLIPGLSPQSWLSQLKAEAGIGYYSAEFEDTLLGTEVDGDLSVVPVTLTAIYTHQLQGTPLQLLGGAGIGLYFASMDVEVSDPFFGSIGMDESTTELGLNFEAGALYPLSDVVSAYAELEWALVSGDVGGVFLDAGVQYRF